MIFHLINSPIRLFDMIALLLILTIICILTVLAGCRKKAEPIDLPSNEAVISIEIITIEGTEADITETNQIETVMTALSAAEPTRLESVNDKPTNVDAYGTISINTVGESTVVYYYDKDSKHYLSHRFSSPILSPFLYTTGAGSPSSDV